MIWSSPIGNLPDCSRHQLCDYINSRRSKGRLSKDTLAGCLIPIEIGLQRYCMNYAGIGDYRVVLRIPGLNSRLTGAAAFRAIGGRLRRAGGNWQSWHREGSMP